MPIRRGVLKQYHLYFGFVRSVTHDHVNTLAITIRIFSEKLINVSNREGFSFKVIHESLYVSSEFRINLLSTVWMVML